MVIWWPKGIHPALHGTNYDLPVSQVDFFATFADVLNYPLPPASSCTYSYNSENANVHGLDDTRIGRPGLSAKHKKTRNPGNAWLADLKKMDWTSNNIYDGSMQSRNGAGKALRFKEVLAVGMDRMEKWLTKEDRTGFLVGWDGCMAEDSISFKSAFSANKVKSTTRNGKEYHQFENNMKNVPTKIQAGQLSDLAIRFGRYKLIRYNVPKDFRTGPTKQHIVSTAVFTYFEYRPLFRKNIFKYRTKGLKVEIY